MNKEYGFSIIVPVYNTRPVYLDFCINNLLSLNYQNYEIIVIDDGSDETTKEELKKYNDEKIVLVSNDKNIGQYLSRCKGIDSASKDYLIFVDSDDYINNDSLKYFNEILNKNEYDMLMFGYQRFDDNGKYHDKHEYFTEGELNKNEVIEELIQLHINGVCMKCIKKEKAIYKINDGDSSVTEGEDLSLSTDLVMNSLSFYYTCKDIYFYRVNLIERNYYDLDNINNINYLIALYNKVFRNTNEFNTLLPVFKNSAIKSVVYKSFLIVSSKNNYSHKKELLDKLNNQDITILLTKIDGNINPIINICFKLLINKNYNLLFVIGNIFKLVYKI